MDSFLLLHSLHKRACLVPTFLRAPSFVFSRSARWRRRYHVFSSRGEVKYDPRDFKILSQGVGSGHFAMEDLSFLSHAAWQLGLGRAGGFAVSFRCS